MNTKKVITTGAVAIIVSVVLLIIIGMFSNKANGASSEYQASLKAMTAKSEASRKAQLEECKAKEKLQLMFLLDVNNGLTTPPNDEVLATKQRLLQTNCFIQGA